MADGPTVTLGRDCAITVDEHTFVGVRNVDVSFSRTETSFEAADGNEYAIPGSRSVVITIETISLDDATVLAGLVASGLPVAVTGTNALGTFIVASIDTSEYLDDVVVYRSKLFSTKQTFSLG